MAQQLESIASFPPKSVFMLKSRTIRIAFRLDASSQIGTGHFMRCLTLADSLKQRGAQIRFVSRHMFEHLRDMLDARGHEFILLNSRPTGIDSEELLHAKWLGTSQHLDAQDTLKVLSDQAWDWLIVDHYALDVQWESAFRQTVKKVLVIDDLADRRHDCNVLLDQNLYADMDVRYAGKVPGNCELLLGPHYALLREEFFQLRASRMERDGFVQRVLILLGGVDAENLTGKVVQAVAQLPDRNLDVDVVIGAQHPARIDLEGVCHQLGFQCHVETPEIAKLMIKADLAIGASGSTSWERCCLGLPTVCLTCAVNQEAIAEGLQAKGAIVNLGDGVALSVADLSKTLLKLIGQPDKLKTLSTVSRGLVDGRGVDRVCNRLWATS